MSRATEIFDLDPGFLDDDWLSAQMRLLMGLSSTGGDGRQRLPECWQGHEDALVLRLNQLIMEMRLRGQATPEPLALTAESVIWPTQGATPLEEQVARVGERARNGRPGRIRLPRNDHELWASYKYTVLARNHQAYLRFGQRIAARAIPYDRLWQEMVNVSHVAPTPGAVRNAVQHMWGYVSNFSSVNPQIDSLRELLSEIQRLAAAHNVSYLLNSTALGELMVWV
ncbi:DUF1722 domain-containing protein [Mangrovitalea sediminis]|uniref:DUF1722 domain-containing protein n=1 Tax=Mangrovitalea sediminis TaxID=1982043 RepID=UPI000BE4BF61|nr:DUF1722 domain-containing protein [Mangrovitalea sediminis]